VIGVAVGDEHVGRVDLVRRDRRERVVRLQERVDDHARVPLGELKARLAKESDVHPAHSSCSVSVGSASLV
jgi:hypothetical protein